MNETTEEKDITAAIERCIEEGLGPAQDLSNGLHMSPGEAASFYKLINGAFQELKDQVTSLTKERDELQFKFEQRGRIMDGMTDEFKKLKSQLSNREEEIKELKELIHHPWRSHKDAPRNGMEITALFGGEEENQIPTIIRYDAEDNEWIDRDFSSFWGDAEFIWTTAPYSEHNNDFMFSLPDLQSKEGEE